MSVLQQIAKSTLGKQIAQLVVDIELPIIKADIEKEAAVLLPTFKGIPVEFQPEVLAFVSTLVDNWTVKV